MGKVVIQVGNLCCVADKKLFPIFLASVSDARFSATHGVIYELFLISRDVTVFL